MIVTPRQYKIIRAATKAHDLYVKGVGDKYRQRRALARSQRLNALRHSEGESLIGQQVG